VLVSVTPSDWSQPFGIGHGPMGVFRGGLVGGRLVRNIGEKQDWEIHKRRDFQNDALIALTARRHGATVVTTNSPDFELLRSELRISLLAAK
jgi:hypothetical protein